MLAAFGALAAVAVCARAPQPAQSQTDAPGVAVVKFGWDKERINWERDPFGGPVENFDEMRVRTRNEKRIDDAKRGGSPRPTAYAARRAPTPRSSNRAAAEGPPRYGFRYKLSVRNGGAKAIKEFDWDYVFTDSATSEELGRHQFTSEGSVAPGKSKEFSFLIPNPPTHAVSALLTRQQNERAGLHEQVVLVRVLYEDGTVWQRR